MDAEVSTHTFLIMIIEESVCFMSCEIILMWYTRNIFLLVSDIFFINWTVPMRDNLPERVQVLGHTHYCTGKQNYLLSNILRFALKICFERIFNIMQLILVKSKWHITCKWKYLIQKFHDICLSYYFKVPPTHLILMHTSVTLTHGLILIFKIYD